MTDLELKAKVETILSAPVLTLKAVEELNALILGPKKTLKTARPKPTSNDRETVKALREQVEILKSQLGATPASDDDLLDQMYVRTIQRTYEIESKGSNVTFNTSERTYKALQISESIWHFAPGCPLTIGTEIKSATSSDSIVIAIKHTAGRIEVQTWTPNSTCQSYLATKTATGNNLSKEGTSISCKLDHDKLTVFNRRYPANTTLKLGEAFYTVTGSYQEGLLATHQIKPYEGLKMATPMQGERRPATENNLPRNFSMYNNQVM